MTVYLDRRFRQVGRIKRSAGTDNPKTIERLNEMLTSLFELGRLDILRSIQKAEYTPLQVWAYFRAQELHKLPTAATMGQLESSFTAWIEDKECSEKHKLSLAQSLRHLIGAGSRTATIADLPELLRSLRPKMKAAKHARSFNLAKAACQAYVKSTLTKANPMYFEVMAVESLKEIKGRKGHSLTPTEFQAFAGELSHKAALIASAMAYTGMGWTEYVGSWEVLPDRILIHGTKRKGRDRFVPRITTPVRVEMPYKAFRTEIAEAGDKNVRPYDFRRTFAAWMDEAEIPRIRRKMYMGHGAKDVTDLYERREVERFLLEDTERLRKLVNATEPKALRLVESA